MIKNVAFVSLGCDKNRVDTENIMYLLSNGGYNIVANFDIAEIIIVNTCAFIESARIEAVETVLEMAQMKKKACQKLIVCGCLSQKYSSEIKADLPEVDAFVGTKDYDKICDIIASLFERSEQIVSVNSTQLIDMPKRILSNPLHYAYLKIADGCDNHCTFCTIPSIRGKYTSRTIDSIVGEAKTLASQGTTELILVAQDVTRYGTDLYGQAMLIQLIEQLTKLDIEYVRLMYCYPELVTDELISVIDNNPKVCKYIDIPLQHIDDGILKLMNRRSSFDSIISLIERIRKAKNYISIRSTFMVGFPSETDAQFESLLRFVEKYNLDNVGVFAYSVEEDTPSAKIKGRVTQKEKLRRVNLIGKAHLKNSKEKNEQIVGKTLKVIYEDIDYERKLFKGRTEFNAPEIDTYVYFKADFVDVGKIYDVKIIGFDNYDLIGEKVNESAY